MSATNTPQSIAVQQFLQMNYDPTSTTILDILGDGTIGEALKSRGFTQVDLLTGSTSDIESTITGIYRAVHQADLLQSSSESLSLPIKSRTYEVIIIGGHFRSGGLPVSILEPLLKIVNSGGIICWSMADPKTLEDDDGQFERYIEKLCDKCKWLSVLGYPKVISEYAPETSGGKPGRFYAMQVI